MLKQHTTVLRSMFSVTRRYTATQTKDLRPATQALERRQRPCLYLPSQPYGSNTAHCLTVAFASHIMTRMTYGLQHQHEE